MNPQRRIQQPRRRQYQQPQTQYQQPAGFPPVAVGSRIPGPQAIPGSTASARVQQHSQPTGANGVIPPPAALPGSQRMPAPIAVNNRPIPGPSIPPAPRFRAQGDDAPTQPTQYVSSKISLPSPESLGVMPAEQRQVVTAPRNVDWNDVHGRLRQLGVIGFNMNKLPDGSFRVAFTLPGSQPDRARMVEVIADSEADAVETALQRAQQSGAE